MEILFKIIRMSRPTDFMMQQKYFEVFEAKNKIKSEGIFLEDIFLEDTFRKGSSPEDVFQIQ